MKTTSKWGIFLNICLILSAVFFVFPKFSFATQYQQCAVDSICSIGEFLYDDDYQPLTTSTCTLNTNYPNGTSFLNSVAMTVNSDGWYSYSIGTSGLSNGIYPTQICCLTGTENTCLDKTFEITTTSSSLVADIWSYPNRALTSFGSLISSIWSNSSRQLTTSTLENGTSLATTDNVNSIGISLATIETKIETISDKIDTLQTSVNSIQSDTTNILNKWSTYNVTDILNYVDSLETQLGNNTQTCADNTVFGHTQCLIDKWGTDSASTIYTAANNAYTTATSLRSELNFNGKSTTAYDEIIAIKAYIDTIESSVGSTSDTSSTDSIFGRIKQVKEAVDAIDSTSLDLSDLLAKWGDYSATDIYDKVKNLSSDVSSLNTVSNVTTILNTTNNNTTNITEIKNQVLAMKALLDVNRTQLESMVNKPIIKSWLEEGSIIFKNLITNPSKLVSQEVPFVYYFPSEVKQEYIIKKSESLEIKYDPAKSAYYATGNFTLKPNETLIVEVEVKDIWTIPQEKIDSLRNQANELFTPLKNTSYFAQGSTLHSDILASLDKIIALQKDAQLPEDKINIYQETKIELDSISRQLDSLKNIVSSAGSIGTLSGFIGGVQTATVWGIVVILVAGFIFLGLYIKSLNSPHKKQPPIVSSHHQNKKNYHKIAFAAVFGLSFGLSTAISYNFFQNKFQNQKSNTISIATITTPTPSISTPSEPLALVEPTLFIETESSVLGETIAVTVTPTTTPTPIPSLTPKTTVVKKVIVTPSINSYVNLRSAPDRNSTLVTKILSGQELNVISEKYNDLGEKWLNVSYEQSNGWILAELTQAIQNSTTVPSAKITIIVPSHDTVYLYSRPSFNASITSKITEDQSADILVETKRWAKVILTRLNVEGWISQDFIQKDTP